MDPFEVLGLIGIVSLWGAIGCVPWFVNLVRSHATGAQWRVLLVASATAAGAALVVPLLRKDTLGFGLSLVAALVAGVVAVAGAALLARDDAAATSQGAPGV